MHPDDGDVLYAATEVGVFASDDGGAAWDLVRSAGQQFLGVPIYGQILAIDLGANSANLVTTGC